VISETALLLAAASIGILHMSAPDHWATLLMLGKIAKWERSRLIGVGLMTALGHVAFSIALGFAIVGLGLAFSAQLSTDIVKAIGAVMLAGGIAYGVRELRARGSEDYEKETLDKLAKGDDRLGRRFRYFAVLGAALSPDLAILPVFLLALPIGLGFALTTAVVFGLASIAALTLFLLLGMTGLGKVFEHIPPEYNDALVGFVIAAVGVYILLFG
jgi:putative Mn2+ efflux pump MntP